MKPSRSVKGCSIPLVWFMHTVLSAFCVNFVEKRVLLKCSIALCAEHGFTEFLGGCDHFAQLGLAEQGRDEDEIAQLQQAVTATRANRYIAERWRPHFLCLLAELYMETRRCGDGLSALTEALAAADEHEDRHYEAATHRLKGELLLEQADSNAVEALGR
jgi:hypothetical protein